MIHSYIKKVLQYLPFKGRKEIQLELEEMILDMCQGDESPENIKKVLLNLGNPSDFALNYTEQKSLIGPKYFGKFKELLFLILKISLPIIFLTSFISILLQIEHQYTIITIVSTFVQSLLNVISAASSIFIILIIIFLILEYTDTQVELDFWEQSIQIPPTLKQVEKDFLIEGILTLVGTTLFLGLITYPEMIGFGSIIDGKIMITQPVFELTSLAPLMPFLYLSFILSFLCSVILLSQRRKTRVLLSIELIKSISYLVLFGMILQTGNILHPNFITTLTQYVPTVSEDTFIKIFDLVPILLMAICFIEISFTSYQLYDFNKTIKKER